MTNDKSKLYKSFLAPENYKPHVISLLNNNANLFELNEFLIITWHFHKTFPPAIRRYRERLSKNLIDYIREDLRLSEQQAIDTLKSLLDKPFIQGHYIQHIDEDITEFENHLHITIDEDEFREFCSRASRKKAKKK